MIKEIKTYLFIIIMCSFSALILSVLSTSLRPRQIASQNSYRDKELLRSANLLPEKASARTISKITKENITPMLLDSSGNTFTFEQKKIDYTDYLEKGIKTGYFDLPLKLFFQMKNGGVIIPVNGFGLWDAIYGYIGIAKDGITIVGISWYDQKETPGLGAEISNPKWQDLFQEKTLFHGANNSAFGLEFVPKAMMSLLPPADKKFSIDAISGATITTHGVQNALKTSLSPYIPLLKKMQK